MEAIDIDRLPLLHCMTCDYQAVPEGGEYTCPVDKGILDVRFSYQHILQIFSKESLRQNPDRSIWRYRSLLPIKNNEQTEKFLPKLQVGYTPLYKRTGLGKRLGMPNLLIKDDTRNPTGSLKDRASAIAVVRAQEEGKEIIAAASTGNAASSIAGMAASAGLKTVIFVPKAIPHNKLAQIIAYGAAVVLVDGSYDDAFSVCEEACAKHGWYNRNTANNPYLAEGKKTVSFEICEQMDWDVPDTIFVPVGDGCVIGGVWKGFHDLRQMGLIQKMPKLIGVQPKGSNALFRAFRDGKSRAVSVQAETIADSLSVSLPKDDVKALHAVRDSGGIMMEVEDEEIREAQLMQSRFSGIFAEPAGSTPLAGLLRLLKEKIVDPTEKALLLVTGSGLKDTQVLEGNLSSLPVIAPDLQSVEAYLRSSKWLR